MMEVEEEMETEKATNRRYTVKWVYSRSVVSRDIITLTEWLQTFLTHVKYAIEYHYGKYNGKYSGKITIMAHGNGVIAYIVLEIYSVANADEKKVQELFNNYPNVSRELLKLVNMMYFNASIAIELDAFGTTDLTTAQKDVLHFVNLFIPSYHMPSIVSMCGGE